MKLRFLLYFTALVSFLYVMSVTGSGCAQIGAPTGGPRDSLPPVLLSATPEMMSKNFSAKRITFYFDEYIDVQDVQNNVLVSPYPKVIPTIEFKLKTVTVRLKDTLLPNTTYSINFGNAIRDNNEGNPYRNFTYVFSTGNTIDSLQFTGKVIVAETGKKDSTIIAMLYRNVDDSAVYKRKPDYIARVDSSGNFHFRNLSEGNYKVYALKDGDGGKTYNSKIEMFAFADSEVVVNMATRPVTLFASAEEKDTKKGTGASAATTKTAKSTTAEKKLRYATNLSNNEQDLLTDLIITFSKPLKSFDPQKIILTDTNYNRLPGTVSMDTVPENLRIKVPWVEDTHYRLLIPKDAVSDSAGVTLTKSDTIRFAAKKESAYGNLLIRFTNLVPSSHPVLQFVKNDEVIKSVPITATQWSEKLFVPGEYEVRVLYDTNNNGKWDPGNYSKKLQPERANTVDSHLNIRANWDNERDIKL